MKLDRLIIEELWQRKVRLTASLLVILLASSVMVTVHTVNRASRGAVATQLQRMGATLFILPASLTLMDYYRMETGHAEMPESHYFKLTSAGLLETDQVRALLNMRQEVHGVSAIVTGVWPLPPSESATPEEQAWLGHDIACQLGRGAGQTVTILDQDLLIAQVFPAKGTIDDMRVTVPLATAQQLFDRGRTVNAIEIVSEKAEALAKPIKTLLPNTRVITKTTLARTQAKTLRLLRKYSYLLLAVVLVIGGIGMANAMALNVRERRREIGTLLAIGATPAVILMVFLKKALYLGLIGGLLGYLFGTLAAVLAGPKLLGLPVVPAPEAAVWAILIAVFFTLISSYLPARKAAGLDPAVILQEG